MTMRKYVVALLATGALFAFGGTAGAAFPNYSDCPRTATGVAACVNIQGVSGSLRIKETTVPLGESLEIRGGIVEDGGGAAHLVPPRGTNGFFARAVNVPGGLLGIDWLPGTQVQAITELAGDADDIRLDLNAFGVTVPVKVRLVNLLLGMNCHIGTNSSPVRLNLITETTSPPPPNRPITGSLGEIEFLEPPEIRLTGAVNVENSFAVPGATSCGLGLGLINAAVNLKLGLPSAAGNNSIDVTNNIGILVLV